MCSEWGDKTQAVAVLLTPAYGFYPVLFGGAAALFTSIIIAIILGSFSRKLPKWLTTLICGLVFFGFGMYSVITLFS